MLYEALLDRLLSTTVRPKIPSKTARSSVWFLMRFLGQIKYMIFSHGRRECHDFFWDTIKWGNLGHKFLQQNTNARRVFFLMHACSCSLTSHQCPPTCNIFRGAATMWWSTYSWELNPSGRPKMQSTVVREMDSRLCLVGEGKNFPLTLTTN
jgi:hypothetical protein